MAIDLDTVVKQLTDSGVIAPGTLENFIPPKAHLKDAEEMARELVKQGVLTRFQAQHVLAGKTNALVLGNYIVLDRLGSGGMGQVFKAEHRRMERVVALKMLPPAMTKDAAALARFQREAKAAAKLSHPNIVAAYDADEYGGVHFLVMEYVEGSDLAALVKKIGPLPVAKAVNYILQAARGLEFAHAEGVVHRDIKPSNLLFDKKGIVKILDMGLARIEPVGNRARQAEITGSGAVMGTVDYMAPEQAIDSHRADARADTYSLGISLYYLIAGRPAYPGESMAARLVAHREQPIPSLQAAGANVPAELEAVFRRMVAKRAEHRYQTMSQVVQALEAIRAAGSGAPSGAEATAAWTPPATGEANTIGDAHNVSSTAKPLAAITLVVSEKSKHLMVKVLGGAFATIFAPILVALLLKFMDKGDPPANAVAVSASALSAASLANPLDRLPFDEWMKTIAKLPAGKQVEAVGRKLKQLNPEFDGQVTSTVTGGVVTGFGFHARHVTDVSPLRALTELTDLNCSGSVGSKSVLADLSPLAGLKLTRLECGHTQVSDLSPLRGMPLKEFIAGFTQISDLAPLRGMPLELLNISYSKTSDLSALEGMKLKRLNLCTLRIKRTKVRLEPLRGMPLEFLDISGPMTVADVTPLETIKTLASLRISAKHDPTALAARLQKSLPNCKIWWEGEDKPKL